MAIFVCYFPTRLRQSLAVETKPLQDPLEEKKSQDLRGSNANANELQRENQRLHLELEAMKNRVMDLQSKKGEEEGSFPVSDDRGQTTSIPVDIDQALMEKAVLNNPPISPGKGSLIQTSNLTLFEKVESDIHHGSTDGETYTALNEYFWGKENGIVIELGGLDGFHISQSIGFLDFHWHRLIMEAAPRWIKSALTKSADATFVHGAVCDFDKVHYVSKGSATTNGIGEFMSEKFLRKYNKAAYWATATNNGTDWNAVPDWKAWSKNQRYMNVQEVPCVKLDKVFAFLNIDHVNFWLLDVEGGELNILQGVDWEKVKFDVLCIETERYFRPEGYPEKVVEFMTSKGYVFDKHYRRNSWFRHPDFVPSVNPKYAAA